MTAAAVDTNILVYAEAVERSEADRTKIERSRQLMWDLAAEGEWFVAAQALAELHRVLVQKLRLARADAAARIARWQSAARVLPTSEKLVMDAIGLASRHRLRIFDAIILAAAAEAHCDTLYSEEFQQGFTWRGVEVVNPFR